MSSIERAMERAQHGGAPVDTLPETGLAVPASSEPPTAPVADATAAPDPGAQLVDDVPAAASEDWTENLTTADALPAPAAVAPSPPSAPPPNVTAGDIGVRAGIPPENYVALDFARLAAAGLLVPDQPMSRLSEEFQHIKRRLLGNIAAGVAGQGRPPNLILITSSVPNEGKTFNSANLAISIAMEVDHTVLAIDTDIMKRDLSRILGVVDRKGLFDLLSDPGYRLDQLLVRTNIPNLVVLPVGTRREGSTELLASVRMRELADELAQRYGDRVVLFDSPPVLATTTATALAPLAGQIVLVAEAGSTKHETIVEALQRLDRFKITGLILNKAKSNKGAYYDYYGSYYGEH